MPEGGTWGVALVFASQLADSLTLNLGPAHVKVVSARPRWRPVRRHALVAAQGRDVERHTPSRARFAEIEQTRLERARRPLCLGAE